MHGSLSICGENRLMRRFILSWQTSGVLTIFSSTHISNTDVSPPRFSFTPEEYFNVSPAQSQSHHLSINENQWSCQILAHLLLNVFGENLPKCMKNLALNKQQYCFAKA